MGCPHLLQGKYRFRHHLPSQVSCLHCWATQMNNPLWYNHFLLTRLPVSDSEHVACIVKECFQTKFFWLSSVIWDHVRILCPWWILLTSHWYLRRHMVSLCVLTSYLMLYHALNQSIGLPTNLDMNTFSDDDFCFRFSPDDFIVQHLGSCSGN